MTKAQDRTIYCLYVVLLPEPFGPDTVVNPSRKGIVVGVANDLKLSISILLMYIKF